MPVLFPVTVDAIVIFFSARILTHKFNRRKMAILEIMSDPYLQKKWELKQWIKKGILWNECPSIVEHMVVFKGGPLDGRKGIMPKYVFEWEHEEIPPAPVEVISDTVCAKPTLTPKYRYVRKGNVMECDK